MMRRLTTALAVLLLTLASITPAAIATAAQDDPKKDHKFKRLDFDAAHDRCWVQEERVRVKPKYAHKYVFLEVRIDGKWYKATRQTTLKNGQFDFGDSSQASVKKYKRKTYKLPPDPDPNTLTNRVRVPGSKKYSVLYGPTCTYAFNS